MILYNVTININTARADEWLQWMQEVHIPDVMSTGMFLESHILRLVGDEDTGGKTYSIQYLCTDMKTYESYRDIYAPALQEATRKKFGDSFVAFRTLLEVIA